MALHVTDTDHTQGAANAPVTLLEYADYQCPYCGEAYYVIKKIQDKMGDKLQLVFRNFPISELHPYAINAAMAAESANLQGKFWEMHDLLFENQKHLTDSDLLGYAKKLKLDIDHFQASMKNADLFEKVKSDFNSGVKNGVQGTPAFFLNGEMFQGNWMDPQFVDYLETFVKK